MESCSFIGCTRKFFQEILGLQGSKISWEKTPRLLRGNFPAKFPRSKFPGDVRKFYEEILGSLDNRTEISTLSQYCG